MSEQNKKVHDVLKQYWKVARTRKYTFIQKKDTIWLSASMDSMVKYCALPRETVLDALDALKTDDRIDYCLCEHENREFVSYTNNW